MKLLRKMSISEKRTWLIMRSRLKQGLTDKKFLLKQDLNLAWKIHRSIYGKPTTRPGINCCIDIATWQEITKNINAAYVAKND